ncbi:EamA family transporter [Clostridium aquiflavi]|uniref:EamA family transporter n=1 Tax=Clostridium aquiflavi TaxID=3073603 RepID=A0ABU1EIZ7_9CLOT|nr:EamA family transporter [Clostridium sp. 5N-1]MDR5588254.1 EamA family transporter [Clostridium sp. 5N-1]
MLESLKKNRKGIALIILSSVFVCIGQLLWKISNTEGLMYILIGFLFYGIGAVFMIVAYRFGSLSVLQPMLSLNYIFTIILAKTVLNESLTLSKIISILIIIMGVILIGGGDD